MSVSKEKNICSLYEVGKSINEIAKIVNLSYSGVYYFLKKNNIKMRPRRRFEKTNPIIEKEICYLYENGNTIKEATEKLNISHSCGSKILSRNNIKIRDRFSDYHINHDYFNKINSHEKATWLGFIIADGNIFDNNLRVTQSHTDLEYLKKLKKCIDSNYVLSYYKKRKVYTFQVKSKKLATSLAKLGIIPNKTYKTKMPDLKEEYINSCIRGIFEGDGTIYCGLPHKKPSYTISISGTKELMVFISEFISKKLCIPLRKLQKDKKTYKISWHGNNLVYKVGRVLYENSKDSYRMRRKYNKFLDLINIRNRKKRN
jgi:orotate phosphoribosyltransferase-like protein